MASECKCRRTETRLALEELNLKKVLQIFVGLQFFFGPTYASLKVDDDPKSLILNSHYVCPFHLQSTSYFWMN